ncbi:MAG: hypothetical protein E7053_07760 [Lentisphaerae bacterium]|nr:hypothetical protein [Lentisphaerota bacterium]
MKEFTIGTMYWINPKKSEAELFDDLCLIRENGISLVRTFICWEYVEIRKDVWEYTMFDRFFRAAARAGVKVMATLVFYLPYFRVKELLADGIDDRFRRIPCLDRPEVKAGLELFFTETVKRYCDNPALHIWNVWNEPTDLRCDCPHSLREFAAYLRCRYKDIGSLQAAWANEYYIFNPILPGSIEEIDEHFLKSVLECGTRSRDNGLRCDWDEFQLSHSAGHLRYLISLVRRFDKVHECHTNPCVGCENPVFIGIDPFVFSKIQDSISISVHPAMHFCSLQKNLDHSSELPMFSQIDLARSWGQGKDAYIGEYQAGSTISKPFALTPGGKDIFATLFHSLARGLRGVIFWQWQAWRHSAFEVGEFSLRNPSDGGETERSRAVAAFASLYHDHREFFDRAVMPPVKAAIFISLEQASLDHLTGFEEKMHYHIRSALLCHRALAQAGITADFVSESVMDEKTLSAYKVLYLPYVRAVSQNTAAKLRKFVADGGAVWADGRCGFLDKYIALHDRIPGHGLDELFGGFECDEIAPRKTTVIESDDFGSVIPYRELQRFQTLPGTQVIAACDGYPAALRNDSGKGSAELWGTPLLLGDMINGTAQSDRIIVDFAVRNGVKPLYAPQSAPMPVSVLQAGNQTAVIVTNCGDAANTFAVDELKEFEQWCGSSAMYEENGKNCWLIPSGETLCIVFPVA